MVRLVQTISKTTDCKSSEQGACFANYIPLIQQKTLMEMNDDEKIFSIMMHKHILSCCFCGGLYHNAKIYLLRGFDGDTEYLEVLEENEYILDFFAKFYQPN